MIEDTRSTLPNYTGTLLTTGHMGTGSGIDTDMLDGHHWSDVTDAVSGFLPLTGGDLSGALSINGEPVPSLTGIVDNAVLFLGSDEHITPNGNFQYDPNSTVGGTLLVGSIQLTDSNMGQNSIISGDGILVPSQGPPTTFDVTNTGTSQVDLQANSKHVPTIDVETVPPGAVVPKFDGDFYLNSYLKNLYVSTGTSTPSDWHLLVAGSLSALSDVNVVGVASGNSLVYNGSGLWVPATQSATGVYLPLAGGTMSGAIVANGHEATGLVAQVSNTIYGSGSPPAAAGYPEGTLYFQYV